MISTYGAGSVLFCSNFTSSYRYGFNGAERDDEVKGTGNSYDFGARMYDARVGRWFSCDAYERKYPELSPYIFVQNSPRSRTNPFVL